MDLKETDILGEDVSQHWYYRSKARAMAKLLVKTRPSSILDVGAGSGFFSRYLLDSTAAQVAWCVDISYDCDSDALQNEKPIHFRRSIDHIESDVILLMDVLEHVDDDVGLLKYYVDAVEKPLFSQIGDVKNGVEFPRRFQFMICNLPNRFGGMFRSVMAASD